MILPPQAASVEEAWSAICRRVSRLPAEEVDLLDAAGRVLAEDITAPTDLWPFPRAAMDGVAVRAADVAAASPERPVTLPVIGSIFAGQVPGPLLPGGAARIATGAVLPPQADAVIPLEQVTLTDQEVIVTAPAATGAHVFPAGEDARRGEVVVRAGTVLRAGQVGLLAALGIARVPVVRRARVAVLAVGDELVEPGRSPDAGQVRDSNTFALAAAVAEAGALPRRVGVIPDDPLRVAAALKAVAAADAVIVCGGMSVGERDVVKEAMRLAGVEVVFWRVPMKPGAPAAFGMSGATPVFGLPGTPGAAMVAFEELVRPALRRMMGCRDVHRPVLVGRLAQPVRVRPGRRRFLWARAEERGGRLVVYPLRGQGTAALRSVSDANALLLVDEGCAGLERGERVRLQLLGAPTTGSDAPAPSVVAVVGAKGAGKTALIERLAVELRRRGLRVAAVKHDAHGFQIDRPGTDTWRFWQAGVEVAAIAGPGKAAVVIRSGGEPALEALLDLVADADVVLVEGYSQSALPKIEVRRAGVASDRPPPAGPVVARVGDERAEGTLTLDDVAALADHLLSSVIHLRGPSAP
ncbi:MAG: molybdopterin-guanine dinucleotide biosynthesis protein B [Armatimonadota bacterium]|nr:molybdopterin-guanine dinucleotide biosynthesis protein B [Armatimonadota bacterium]MDR7403392.1 molybdopterin-guanine dinucleotide biosynthesis protein B [Armatimonadota bacterium]